MKIWNNKATLSSILLLMSSSICCPYLYLQCISIELFTGLVKSGPITKPPLPQECRLTSAGGSCNLVVLVEWKVPVEWINIKYIELYLVYLWLYTFTLITRAVPLNPWKTLKPFASTNPLKNIYLLFFFYLWHFKKWLVYRGVNFSIEWSKIEFLSRPSQA